MPVGENLLGGAVSVVPATSSDQVHGMPMPVYMVHYYNSIKKRDGSHLVVSEGWMEGELLP